MLERFHPGVAEKVQCTEGTSVGPWNRDPPLNLIEGGLSGQVREGAANLAGGARDFAHAVFQFVELFEHGHGDDDFMFLKLEQGGRIVQQHIGIQHIQPLGFLVESYHRGQGSWVMTLPAMLIALPSKVMTFHYVLMTLQSSVSALLTRLL